MSTGYILLDNPNRKRQYRTTRRAKPSGAIVIHTPEAGVDLKPPDSKAEDVLGWITRRDDYGSYHGGVDSDSIALGAPWDHEVWGSSARAPSSGPFDDDGDRLRSNSIAIHLFVACNAEDWEDLPAVWVDEAIQRLAILASNAAAWLQSEHGITVPARLGTRAMFWDLVPGFYYHGELQDDRTDPGAAFPIGEFLAEFEALTGGTPEDPITSVLIHRIQSAIKATGYTIDTSGVMDERTAWAVEDMAKGIERLLRDGKIAAHALNDSELARVAALSRATELEEARASAVNQRDELAATVEPLSRFLGRASAVAHGLTRDIETLNGYVDEAVEQTNPTG